MRKKIRFSIGWNALVTFINVGLQLSQVAIVSRFVSPSEIGFYAVIMVWTSLAYTLSEMGVSSVLINNHKEITNEKKSSLLFITLAFNLLIFVTVLVPVLLIYGSAKLSFLTIIALGCNLLFNLIYAQQKTAAEINLKYKIIALCTLTLSVTTLILIICLLLLGFGVYSLIYANVFSSLISVFFGWIFLTERWLPTILLDFNLVKQEIQFGLKQLATLFSSQAINFFDLLIFNYYFGSYQTGLFSVSKNLITQVYLNLGGVINKIYFVALSLVKNSTQFPNLLNEMIHLNMILVVPIYGSIFIYGKEIVLMIFGDDYVGAGTYLSILSVFGLSRSILNGVTNAILAAGLPGLNLRINLIYLISSILFLSLACSFGVTVAVCSVSILAVSITLIAMFYAESILGPLFVLMKLPILALALFVVLSFGAKAILTSIHVINKNTWIVEISCVFLLYFIALYFFYRINKQ